MKSLDDEGEVEDGEAGNIQFIVSLGARNER